MCQRASKYSIIIAITTLANNPRMGKVEGVDAIVWATSWFETKAEIRNTVSLVMGSGLLPNQV